MKTILTRSAIAMALLLLCFQSKVNAQQSLYRIRLQDAFNHVLSLDGPTTGFTSSWALRFPSAGTAAGSVLYTSDAAGQLSWLPATTNGFILTLSGGLPTWSDPSTALSSSYWSLSGNSITTAYAGVSGSFIGTTNTQPFVLATTNTGTPQPMEFFTGNSERMRISGSGSVLIGTSTPISLLTVNGETYSTTFLPQITVANPTYTEGRVFYDTTEKTLSYYNDHNGITMNLGQEHWIRVRNVTGSSISNGAVVYLNGANAATSLPTIALAKADAIGTSDAVGVTTETIANNAIGYVTTLGVVHQLNTSGFTAGQTLYVSPTTAGVLTATQPAQPNFANPIGFVVTSNATTGRILVNTGGLRAGSLTAGAVAFGGSDGFIKQNATTFFWDSTNSRLGIGTNSPGSPLTVTGGVTASSAAANGVNVTQTITAAANNDVLHGLHIVPTFTNSSFTGLTNYSIFSSYAGTLSTGAALRAEATGNGGANGKVIGAWGIATDATQASNTNAGTGVRAQGNGTSTGTNSNIALDVREGELVVARQGTSTTNNTGTNLIKEDDATSADKGPSGVIDMADGGLPTASTSTTGTSTIFNVYAKSNSIILLSLLDQAPATAGVLGTGETILLSASTRANGSFTISLRRTRTAGAGGTSGNWRIGFLIINAAK